MIFKRLLRLVVIILCRCDDGTDAAMEGFVVGGDFAAINSYPHSAFLAVSCVHHSKVSSWICGGSILNQHFTLTAAHCLEDCLQYSSVSITVGNADKSMGFKTSAQAIKIHEEYDSESMKNDIALVRLRSPLKLGASVKRVALTKNPPYNEAAYVAGWGLVDEVREIGTKKLKHVRQTLWSRTECTKVLKYVPVGAFCAGSKNSQTNYAASGDSGSALIVREYIQVGIVSFKMPHMSNSLSVYTEVKHFYDWIQRNTRHMFCYKKQ